MPSGFESRRMGSKKPATELVTGFSDSVVPPAGCPRAAGAARFRCVAPLLACCAGKRFAFPQLRTLPGSNSGVRQQKARHREGNGLLISNGAPNGMSACGWRRPLPLCRFAPCVLRWKTLRVSSAPHPAGFEPRHMDSKKPATENWQRAFQFKWCPQRDSNP